MKRQRAIFGSRSSSQRQRKAPRQFRARFEHLEARALLSATPAPQLLKDINTTPLDSAPHLGTKLGRFTYFTAIDPTHGEELWRSDGTEAGTKLVKDIDSGAAGPGSGQPANSNVRDMIVFNGALYFSAEDSAHGTELWRSDGTRDGTKLLKDIEKGSGHSTVADLVVYRGAIYFSAWDHVHSGALWKTNGTTSGTVLVKSFGASGDNLDALTLMNGKLYFTAGDLTTSRKTWVSDGTTSGTKPLTGYPSNARAYPFASVGGHDYFRTDNSLYRSNGPNAAPKLLKTFTAPNSSVGAAMVVGRQMYFTVQDNTGNELWRTDGTIQGTKLVSQLNNLSPGTFGANITSSTSAGGKLFFTIASDVNNIELWSSDGTRTGTNMVRDIDPTANGYPQIVHTAGNTVFFTANDGTHGSELWRTDGTDAKTLRVADYNGTPVTSFLFQGYDPVHGRELWTSDGTTGGTALVKDIDPRNAGINAQFLGDAQGVKFFEADTSDGRGLWKTDGTTEGTSLVHELRGTATAATLGNVLYFFQPDEAGTSVELWQSDGTPEGTVLVKHLVPTPMSSGFPLLVSNSPYTSSVITGGTTIDLSPRINSIANLTVVGNTLYFTANDRYGSGNELWKTDGTEAGTVLVKDVFEGSSGSNPHALVELNGELYFRANSPLYTDSLWKTDGTPENTVLVKEFSSPAFGSPFQAKIVALEKMLYFVAYDSTTGYELWVSDGTTDGTQPIDLTPGAAGSNPRIVRAAGDNLFFTKGHELWCTNGTPEGTVLLNSNLSLPIDSDGSVQAIALGDRIIFSVANETAPYASVWSSNGTAAGTMSLANVQAEFFTMHDGKVYFTGFTTERGDVWETDGTPAGTKSIVQLDSGAAFLTSLGDNLLFTTNDHLHGNELWKLEISAAPTGGGLIKSGTGTFTLLGSDTTTAGGTLRGNAIDDLFATESLGNSIAF